MKKTITLNKLNKIVQILSKHEAKTGRHSFLADRSAATSVSIAPGHLISGNYQVYLAEKTAKITEARAEFVKEQELKEAQITLRAYLFAANVNCGVHGILTTINVLDAKLNSLQSMNPDRDVFLSETEFQGIKQDFQTKTQAARIDVEGHVSVLTKKDHEDSIATLRKELSEAKDRLAELNATTKVEIDVSDIVAKEIGL